MRISNGLQWRVPVTYDPNVALSRELETLFPDFWRFEMEGAKSYKPKDYKTGNRMKFDMKDFFNDISKMKSDFAMYLGSETTPPCIGKIICVMFR